MLRPRNKTGYSEPGTVAPPKKGGSTDGRTRPHLEMSHLKWGKKKETDDEIRRRHIITEGQNDEEKKPSEIMGQKAIRSAECRENRSTDRWRDRWMVGLSDSDI